MEPVSVFFSYSHKDEKLRDSLASHLAIMQRNGEIQSWHDRQISAGTEWSDAIDDNLNSSAIILLLIQCGLPELGLLLSCYGSKFQGRALC